MGFTADKYADADHRHYVRWKNGVERYSLADLRGRANNFDSLSISTASAILKKKQAMHKILIVISDGQPSSCCTIDIGNEKAYADLKEVIRTTRKDGMDVLGIAIGNSDTETLKYFYGHNFFHLKDEKMAFVNISKEIADFIKKW